MRLPAMQVSRVAFPYSAGSRQETKPSRRWFGYGWGFVLLLAVSSIAWGQVAPDAENDRRAARGGESVFLDTDSVAIKKLETVRDFLNAEQWPDAIDLLRQISEQHGDKLVSISRGRYVNVQTYCNMLQAQLLPEGLKLYRARVDPQARQWFEAAAREKSDEPLLRIVQQAFASSYGDRALMQLGDHAWERGDLASARSYWQKLLPAVAAAPRANTQISPERVSGPVYPDTRFDQAQIRARLVLASLLQGNAARGRQELHEFATDHPRATGKLAGREGRLAEILQGVLKEAETSDPRRDSGEINTFAGNPQRNKVLPQAVDVGAVQWSASLKETVFPAEIARREGPREFFALFERSPGRAAGVRPGYFPVICKNVVLACDDVSIYAWNLQTGKPAWPGTDANSAAIYTLPLERRRQSAVTRPIAGLPWYTLTVDRGRAYARLGSIALGQINGVRTHSLGSFLVSLDIEEGEGKLVWLADASQIDDGAAAGGDEAARDVDKEEGGNWSFDGTPVAAGDRIYVGLRRSQPRPQVNVACLDAGTGRLLWNRKVCSGLEMLGGEAHEAGHQVLTLADGRLYYTTNLGAVAALDTRDGRLRWVATYSHVDVEKVEEFTIRQKDGPNPCLFNDGIVVAAPTDSDSLLAYDSETGRLLWQRQLPHRAPRALLGVSRGKLIVSGDRLYAFSFETGEIAWRVEGNDPELSGYGRGVLADDLVYWPNREEILLIDQDTGKLRRRVSLTAPVRYGSGNLVATEGYLLIAEPNRIVCRCEYGRLIKQYQEEIVRRPRAALPYYLLATAEEATSEAEAALVHYRHARELAGPEEEWESQPLRKLACIRLFKLLDAEGQKAINAGKYSSAARHFSEAATLPIESAQTLQATLQWADALERDGKATESASVLQRVLDTPALAMQRFSRPEGKHVRQWTSTRWATKEIGRLIASHGRAVYQSQELAARDLFVDSAKRNDLPALRRALERYPHANVAPQFWLQLGRASRDQGNFAAAATAFRALLDAQALPEQRSEALAELARQAESRGFYNTAASWWRRLEQEFPSSKIATSAENAKQNARQFVAEKLQRPEYQSATALLKRDPELSRAWEKTLAGGSRCLFPEGTPPGAGWNSLLVVNSGVACLDAQTGRVRWQLASDDSPIWAAFGGDLLILGAQNGILAVEPDNGRVAWRHPWETPGALRSIHSRAPYRSAVEGVRFPRRTVRGSTVSNRRAPSVRTVSLDRTVRVTESSVTCDYRWDGSHILCLIEERSLEAVNPLNGETEWSFQPPAGALQSGWCVSAGHITLQTLAPNRNLVLDAATGSLTVDVPGLDMPWQSSPVPLTDGKVLCVTNPLRLQLFDPATGKVVWNYEGPISQAHAIPSWIVYGEILLLLKDGAMLTRVDPTTGTDLWSTRIASVPKRNAFEHLSGDAQRVWYAGDGVLSSFDLQTGALRWEQYLGFSSLKWQILDFRTTLGIVPQDVTTGAGMLVCGKETGLFLQRAPLFGFGSHIYGHRYANNSIVLVGESKVAGWRAD